MTHISSRAPYLSSRKVLTNPAAPSTSEMMLRYLSLLSRWLGPVLCVYTAFLHQSSCFLSLTWTMVGAFFSSVVVVCSPPLFTVWAWTYLTRWEQQLHLCQGRGAASSICRRVTLLRHSPWLWLVVLTRKRWNFANQIRATGWSHRVDSYTADLYLIVLSDCDDNLMKYNKKIVTDNNFKHHHQVSYWIITIRVFYKQINVQVIKLELEWFVT